MFKGQTRRVMALAGFLVAALVGPAAVSAAQPPGSELLHDVSAGLAGEDASIALEDVSAFPPSGEAVFEPGSTNEERFTYSSVDSNRLVGLSRSGPVAHSAGVFVEAPPGASPTPTDEPSASEATTPPASSDSASGESAEEGPDPCFQITGKSCVDTVLGPFGDTDPCDPNNPGPGCIQTSDPCDPENTGQTCEEKVAGLVATSDDGCDPDNTGQTCLDYFLNPSGSYSQPVETIIPVPDLGDGQDGIHQPCYLFTKITRIGIHKDSGSADAKEFADGYIRTNCESPRVRKLKITAAIYHHSAIPFFGATISTQDSGETGPPGPAYANAFQEVRVLPDHMYGSRINFYFIYRATLRNGDQATAMDCFSMMYGVGQPTLVSCGEDLPLLFLD